MIHLINKFLTFHVLGFDKAIKISLDSRASEIPDFRSNVVKVFWHAKKIYLVSGYHQVTPSYSFQTVEGYYLKTKSTELTL